MICYHQLSLPAQCTLDQWEAVEKNLRPEAKLQCLLHFSAPYLQLKILQAVFHASPIYDINTGETSFRSHKYFKILVIWIICSLKFSFYIWHEETSWLYSERQQKSVFAMYTNSLIRVENQLDLCAVWTKLVLHFQPVHRFLCFSSVQL